MSEIVQDSPADAERSKNREKIETFLSFAFEVARDVAKTPGDIAKSGLKAVLGDNPGVVQYFDRQRVPEDTEVEIAEKFAKFDTFLASKKGTYQDVFIIGTDVLKGFTSQVRETRQIDIVIPEDEDHAPIPMLNGHRLEIHKQSDEMSVVLHGWVEKKKDS